MAIPKREKVKGHRRESSDQLSIEELSPDDMGYDGDVEVLHPDQYEEPESEFEDNRALWRVWPDTDDELAGRLRKLSCDGSGAIGSRQASSDRGRKRRSKEMDLDDQSPLPKRTVIEVSELVDPTLGQPPLKRRRRKLSKQSIAHRLMKRHAMENWSDSSDKTDDHDGGILSSNPGTPETVSTPVPQEQGSDAMDMG